MIHEDNMNLLDEVCLLLSLYCSHSHWTAMGCLDERVLLELIGNHVDGHFKVN